MKAVIIILSVILIIVCISLRKIWKLYGNSNRMYEQTTGELNHIIETYDIWLRLEHDGLKIKEYLKDIGVRKVALCRMTNIGLRLYRELKDSEIKIEYLIDSKDVKLADMKYTELDADYHDPVDMVIITDLFEYGSLKDSLEKKGYKNIDSIDGILYAMLKKQAEGL